MSFLQLKNVSKTYKNGMREFTALENIGLTFSSRGFVVILGRSGCGKSTLLNLLGGIDVPSSGEMIYRGKPTKKWREKAWSEYRKKSVSTIFQHYNLFPFMDGVTNVMLPLLIDGEKPSVAQRRAEEVLALFSLSDFSKRKVDSLSGGECQRLAILRSVSKNPQVILADEPTGALDGKNAEAVMALFKELSKDHLVIIVSHNRELATQYADRLIQMNEGKIVSDSKPIEATQENELGPIGPKIKQAKSGSWAFLFSKEHFRSRKGRNALGIIAATVGFAASLLTFGFYFGSTTAVERSTSRYFDYETATISKKTVQTISDSPLQLTQTVRPSRAEAEQFSNYIDGLRVELDFSSLFIPFPNAACSGQTIADFQYLPIDGFPLDEHQTAMISAGHTPNVDSLDEIIINHELETELKTLFSLETVLGLKIHLSINLAFDYYTGTETPLFITDYFQFDKEVTIVAVATEFSFLNTPKAFYSHRAAKSFLKSALLPNLSSYLESEVSWYHRLQSVEGSDPLSAYGFRLFLNDEGQVGKLYALAKKIQDGTTENYLISSESFLVKDTLLSMNQAISVGLIFFIAIAWVGSIFIIGIIDFSSFVEKKKEVAILYSMGAERTSIRNIFIFESLGIGFLSVICALPISGILAYILNQMATKYLGLSDVVAIPFLAIGTIPFLLETGLLALAFITSYGATMIPLTMFDKISLADELRDE
ncbi:MAG: ABC transporter ATP-binding protein/permease [Firmicutes bacterium]|nr:ABC transporter ATP-binding protein/permease [Bacillota bacterium]